MELDSRIKEGNAHYFPKHAHNCRVFKIIRNQNEAED